MVAGPHTKYGWRLAKELVAGGREKQAAGCQEEKRTWDLVVVLVVEQAAGHQEGGWTTGKFDFIFLLKYLNHIDNTQFL